MLWFVYKYYYCHSGILAVGAVLGGGRLGHGANLTVWDSKGMTFNDISTLGSGQCSLFLVLLPSKKPDSLDRAAPFAMPFQPAWTERTL